MYTLRQFSSADTTCNRVDKDIHFLQPVMEVHTGFRGHPKKVVDVNFLKEVMSVSQQITCSELACSLGIHWNTLQLFMHDHGIQHKYSDITDTNLDSFVKEFKRRWPESGIRYIVGFLRKNGIHVQYLWVVCLL